jgi:hypothetical protein
MPEWQQRVVDELSAKHRSLLVRQREQMAAYANTLEERISLFHEMG